MKILSSLLCAMLVTFITGCGQSGQGRGEVVSEIQKPVIELASTKWDSPVTETEIDQFLEIIQHLPDRKVPALTRAELALDLEENETADEYIAKLRQSLRAAINPQKQGSEWENQKAIAKSFRALHVAPQDFAALSTKMSFAWSAASVKGELPILLTQRRLKEQLDAVKLELDQMQDSENKTERRQKLQKVQELVALGEFLQFVQEIPEESLAVIRANQTRLDTVFPEVDLTAQFENFLDGTKEVSQAQHTRVFKLDENSIPAGYRVN